MREYKCISIQTYSLNNYQIVPIRDKDRYKIMQWRNDQIYHLRQSKILTKEIQDEYFNNVIAKLFEKEYPDQILFSYLENEKCIGYGGLVHINWLDKNAEISFIINTSSEKIEFEIHWKNFLYLIEKVAFEQINIHKIFTYAFNVRPQLFKLLVDCNYIEEARLKEHCIIDNKYHDILIHTKYNS
jgi:RimJ/RimL family protein N-acetyltransferase